MDADKLFAAPQISIQGEPAKPVSIYQRADGSVYSDDSRVMVSIEAGRLQISPLRTGYIRILDVKFSEAEERYWADLASKPLPADYRPGFVDV